MKKIIALAVAGAFVAPAMAADISVSGSVEYFFITGESSVDGTERDYFSHNDNSAFISATEEVNGLTVSATMSIVDDTDGADSLEQDGSSLEISGAFGKVSLGDVSGALDSVGDYTDVASLFGGFALDGDDSHMKYTSPTIGGLTVIGSYSAETELDTTQSTSTDSQGISAKFAMGPAEIYAGTESIGDYDATAYGLKVSAQGVTFAAEFGEEEAVPGGKTKHSGAFTLADGDLDFTSYALTYKVGDITIGGEMHEVEEDGNSVALRDLQVYFVEYGLGSNVDLYVSYANEEGISYAAAGSTPRVKNANTAIGAEYNF